MFCNFHVFWKQVALVIEPKDREATTMYKQALELLSQALEVWPNANVKFNDLERLPRSIQQSQSKDPSTALAQCLDVMNKVLENRPHFFIRNNINQISQVCHWNMDPFFFEQACNYLNLDIFISLLRFPIFFFFVGMGHRFPDS